MLYLSELWLCIVKHCCLFLSHFCHSLSCLVLFFICPHTGVFMSYYSEYVDSMIRSVMLSEYECFTGSLDLAGLETFSAWI